MASNVVFIPPGDGEIAPFMPGERFAWKVAGNAGGLDFSELSLDPGVKTPEHIHHGNEEIYYVLDGSIRFVADGKPIDAATGSFVLIPRGTPHAWANLSSSRTRLLLIFSPGGMKGYFDELEPLLPELMAGLEDMSKVDAKALQAAEDIMRRYQYEMVGPPPA